MPAIDLTHLGLLSLGVAIGIAVAAGGFLHFHRNRRALWQAEWRARAAQLGAKTELAQNLLERTEARLHVCLAECNEQRELATSLKERHARLEVLLQTERQTRSENAAQLTGIEQHLAQATRVLAADALQANNQQFLTLAQNTLERYLERAQGEIDRRGQALEITLQPLYDSLSHYQAQLQALERDRDQTYGGLRQHLHGLAESQRHLEQETGRLARALRVPHVRGRWGEITLRRVVELAGMQDRCDFIEQQGIAAGTQRPDMLVLLPGAKRIAVDAKVPLSAYLEALEADTDLLRNERMAVHARQVQAHITALSQKAYWESLQPSPEFVVLFIPGENFFSAALSIDASLIEKGAARGVLLATPTTLIALLRTVALAWREQALSENARNIQILAGELIARIGGVSSHMRELGRSVERCAESYRRMCGSFERRVLSTARRLSALGVGRSADATALALGEALAAGDAEPSLESAAAVENRPTEENR